MNRKKSKSTDTIGANINPPILVLNTLDGFWEETAKASAKTVYLTATSEPPAEPASGRAGGEISEIDRAAQPEKVRRERWDVAE